MGIPNCKEDHGSERDHNCRFRGLGLSPTSLLAGLGRAKKQAQSENATVVCLEPAREECVPIDEEQPEFALEIEEEAKKMLQVHMVKAGIAGKLSLIPFVGEAVIELMRDLAMQRLYQRMNDMFEHFTNRIREIGEDKVDREWFRGEEFQTLLSDAFQQLNATHDEKKLEMLGTALANSGAPGFKEEEQKDLFIRFVRELTPQHIKVLLELAPQPVVLYHFPAITPDTQYIQASDITPRENPDEETVEPLRWNRRPRLSPDGDDLLAIQMLHAYGLVEEEIKSSIDQPRISHISSEGQAREVLRQFIKNVENAKIERSFRLSTLGDRFLKFMGLPKIPTQKESA
jgi:hypothetical protein